MKNNALEPSAICTGPDSCELGAAPEPSVPVPAPSLCGSAKIDQAREHGRFALGADRRARIAEIRASLVHEAGLPGVWREQLETELSLLLEATEQILGRLGVGLLRQRGETRAPYGDYRVLAERIAAVCRQLGRDEPERGGKRRAWSKLSREEQEREAQRALAEVESNLRASNFERDDDEE
jgi:hypothetical protein